MALQTDLESGLAICCPPLLTPLDLPRAIRHIAARFRVSPACSGPYGPQAMMDILLCKNDRQF